MPESADSDSEPGGHTRSARLERTKPWHTPDDVPWTLLGPAELADAYDAVVAPALRRADRDPETDRPSYEWLSNNGFRSLTYTLREHHDTTLSEWWDEYIGDDADEGYDWQVDHDETRESFQQYLDAKQADSDEWSDTTRDAVRYRLARYARSYREHHGTDDLLAPVAPDSDIDETAAVDRCRETLRYMGREFASSTVARVHDAVRAWYTWLEDRRVAAFNPTNGAADWFGWDRSTAEGDPVALDTDHVRAMFDAAVTSRDRMLVVALCAWGLRAGEVAALHADQLVLDDDRPRVEFDERKNGPGSVAIVFGADVARARMASTAGWLFPSTRSQTGHVHRTTIANWFHDLADRAGVPETIDGVDRKPHMGRRWWYNRYSETIEGLLAHVEEIAADQGSASARVVMDDYLSEERRRELRREFMREKLNSAFGGN